MLYNIFSPCIIHILLLSLLLLRRISATLRSDTQRPKQQSAECSREIPRGCIFIYHKCYKRAFLFAILLIIRRNLSFNLQTVVIMNVDKLLNNAVRLHNLTNPDFIIHKTQCGALTFYFLYCQDGNIWNSDECRLFLYLYDKLSQDRIYPFIALRKICGEDKIGIYIDATKTI